MTRMERQLDLQMNVSGPIDSPTARMKVIGEFDRLQISRFDQAAGAVPPNLVKLVVDLSETTIIDSAALGGLIRLRHSLDRLDAALEVHVEKPFQITVMTIGGLMDFLDVHVISSEPTPAAN